MNSLRTLCLATTATFALLAAAISNQAQAQVTPTVADASVPMPYGDGDLRYAPLTHPRTREDVRAELMAYLAAGGYVQAGDESGPRAEPFVSTKTRAEVMAEAAASRANGEYTLEGDTFVFRAVAPTMLARQR